MPRQGRSNPELLFSEYDFHAVQENQRRKMNEAIDQAPAEQIKSREVEPLVEEFVWRFRLDAPELTEGATSVTVEEAQVDASGDFSRRFFSPGPHYMPGIRATYYVPFQGERKMFKCRPNRWTSVIPAAELGNAELLFTIDRTDQNVAATKSAFEEEVARVKEYLGWLKENADSFKQSLPETARQRIMARKARLAQMEAGVQSLGVPIRSSSGAARVTRTPERSALRATARAVEMYDVALSFAGEQRPYVEEVAVGLRAAGVSVFYDAFEKAELWGKNLVDHLADVYQKRSRYVVMFISAQYVEKAWPRHERIHAQERSLVAKEEYILPARFDDTEVSGMTSTVAYVDLSKMAPAELVHLILAKLGQKR